MNYISNTLLEYHISNGVECIKKGGILLHPTDTVWGLACDINNDLAIEKIIRIKNIDLKNRNGFILVVNSIFMLKNYVTELNSDAIDILNNITEPTTIVYEGGRNCSKYLLGKDNTIAIRLIRNDKNNDILKLLNKIIDTLKSPFLSTSANISGQKTPQELDEVAIEIKNSVDYIIDLDIKGTGKPSKIIKLLTNGEIITIRE